MSRCNLRINGIDFTFRIVRRNGKYNVYPYSMQDGDDIRYLECGRLTRQKTLSYANSWIGRFGTLPDDVKMEKIQEVLHNVLDEMPEVSSFKMPKLVKKVRFMRLLVRISSDYTKGDEKWKEVTSSIFKSEIAKVRDMYDGFETRVDKSVSRYVKFTEEEYEKYKDDIWEWYEPVRDRKLGVTNDVMRVKKSKYVMGKYHLNK